MKKYKCKCLKPFVFNDKKYLVDDDLLMTSEEIDANKRFVFKYYAKQ